MSLLLSPRMFRRVLLPVTLAVVAFALPLRTASGQANRYREVIKLADQAAQQSLEIHRLTRYVSTLRRLVGDSAAATRPAAQPDVPYTPDERFTKQKLSVAFKATPFAQCIDHLAAAGKVTINVNWPELAKAGYTKDAPITLQMTDVPIIGTLKMILAGAEGARDKARRAQAFGGPQTVLIYIDKGIAHVSTKEDFDRHPVTRVFDVSWLLADVRDAKEQQSQREALVQQIMDSVAPKSWKAQGGSVGVAAINGTRLTVTHSPIVMPQVDQLLDYLLVKSNVEIEIKRAQARIAEQEKQLAALRGDAAMLTAQLKAAGKPVPRQPVPLEQVLASPIPSVKFSATPLVKCVDFLRDASGANFFVNWPELERAGVSQEAPVTLELAGKPLSQVLTQVLQQVGTGKVTLDFLDSDYEGVIHLSTREAIDRNTTVRSYDVQDLMDGKPNPVALDRISQAMQAAVEPASWQKAGGKGAVRAAGGSLVVTHSERVHKLIAAHFKAQREPAGKPVK